jgi:hypothetical protein
VSGADGSLPPGGRVVSDPVWEPWSPWEVQARLRGVSAPWYVAAGWALDLFRGEQTREHADIEIGLPASAEAFGQVRAALASCVFEAAGSGLLWPADGPALAVTHQTWVSEDGPPWADGRPERVYRLDVFREPHRDGRWVCRHDETIALPYDEIIRGDTRGVPFLAPPLVLLFKARANRPKDRADLAGVLPLLARQDRAWLAAAVRRNYPGHEWLARL